MEVKVLDRRRLAAQARLEEIVDVRHLSVEEVVAFKRQPDLLGQLVPDFAVEDGCRLRLHARILDEGPRTEVPEPESSKWSFSHAAGRIHRHSSRDHAVERAWYERFVLGYVEKPGVREREVQVECHPRVRVNVVGELESVSAARRSRLGAA